MNSNSAAEEILRLMQEAAAEKARKKAEEKAETEHDEKIATIVSKYWAYLGQALWLTHS